MSQAPRFFGAGSVFASSFGAGFGAASIAGAGFGSIAIPGAGSGIVGAGPGRSAGLIDWRIIESE